MSNKNIIKKKKELYIFSNAIKKTIFYNSECVASESPDFLIEAFDLKIGIELVGMYDDKDIKLEGRRRKAISKIKRVYFEKNDQLIEINFLDDNILSESLNIDKFVDDLILQKEKLQENKRSDNLIIQNCKLSILKRKNGSIQIAQLRWLSILSSVGWINQNPNNQIQGLINKKSQLLEKYNKNLDKHILLIHFDRLNSSGKFVLQNIKKDSIKLVNFDEIWIYDIFSDEMEILSLYN